MQFEYIMLAFAFCGIILFFYLHKKDFKIEKNYIYLIMFAALFIRIILALKFPGHKTDMGCFSGWAASANTGGLKNFYSPDYFCDYPPGYIYILYFLGFIKPLTDFWLKTPSIIADVLTVYFLYSLFGKSKFSLLGAAFYAFAPMVFYNSAIWGQVDSILTLMIVLAIYFLMKEKMLLASFILGLAILLKPQALLFGPVFLFVFIYYIFIKKDKSYWIKLFYSIVVGLLTIYLFSLPFAKSLNPKWLIDLYGSTLSSYPYQSVNAFNLLFLLGKNWIGVETLFIPNFVYSVVIIAISVIYGAFIFLKSTDKSRFFYVPAMILIIIFTFNTKMHERYLFPCLALMLVAYICTKSLKTLILAAAISLQNFLNCAYVLKLYLVKDFGVGAYLTSALSIIICFLAIYWGYTIYVKPKKI